MLSHAFAEGAMKEMQRYILGNVRTFCEQLGAASSGAIATAGRTLGCSSTSIASIGVAHQAQNGCSAKREV